MAFSRTARLTAVQARSLGDLLAQFGDVGLENGPRTGSTKRSTVSNEAYLGRRLFEHLAGTGEISFPISIEHGDGPDFLVTHASGNFSVEVTEVCPKEDGHRYANESGGQCSPIGDYSSTGSGQARHDLLDQLNAAIERKTTKPYAGSQTTLLLYPNSDAAQWIGLFDRDDRPSVFDEVMVEPFGAIYALWGDRIVKVGRS